jgi:hypothetical protein
MVFRSDFVNEVVLFKNIFLSVLFAVLKFSQDKNPQIFEGLISPFFKWKRGRNSESGGPSSNRRLNPSNQKILDAGTSVELRIISF